MENRRQSADTGAVACSLGPDQLADRVGAWRRVVSRSLRRQVEPGRIISVYPREPDLHEQLTRLIDAEADCCPFLRLTLDEVPGGLRLVLEYPEGFEGLLGPVLDGDKRPS